MPTLAKGRYEPQNIMASCPKVDVTLLEANSSARHRHDARQRRGRSKLGRAVYRRQADEREQSRLGNRADRSTRSAADFDCARHVSRRRSIATSP